MVACRHDEVAVGNIELLRHTLQHPNDVHGPRGGAIPPLFGCELPSTKHYKEPDGAPVVREPDRVTPPELVDHVPADTVGLPGCKLKIYPREEVGEGGSLPKRGGTDVRILGPQDAYFVRILYVFDTYLVRICTKYTYFACPRRPDTYLRRVAPEFLVEIPRRAPCAHSKKWFCASRRECSLRSGVAFENTKCCTGPGFFLSRGTYPQIPLFGPKPPYRPPVTPRSRFLWP